VATRSLIQINSENPIQDRNPIPPKTINLRRVEMLGNLPIRGKYITGNSIVYIEIS
jgi:hypothetical protein